MCGKGQALVCDQGRGSACDQGWGCVYIQDEGSVCVNVNSRPWARNKVSLTLPDRMWWPLASACPSALVPGVSLTDSGPYSQPFISSHTDPSPTLRGPGLSSLLDPEPELPESHNDQYDFLPEQGGQEVGLFLKDVLEGQESRQKAWWRCLALPTQPPLPCRPPQGSLTRRQRMSSGI